MRAPAVARACPPVRTGKHSAGVAYALAVEEALAGAGRLEVVRAHHEAGRLLGAAAVRRDLNVVFRGYRATSPEDQCEGEESVSFHGTHRPFVAKACTGPLRPSAWARHQARTSGAAEASTPSTCEASAAASSSEASRMSSITARYRARARTSPRGVIGDSPGAIWGTRAVERPSSRRRRPVGPAPAAKPDSPSTR